MQHNILFFFACLNFELTISKDLWTKVAAMRRKGDIFSEMFVLRSMGKAIKNNYLAIGRGSRFLLKS